MKNIHNSILSTIGNTPLVDIRVVNPNKKVKIYAKMECFNPGGSIKDRVALYMIEQAEKRGELTKDKVILEATSGNTGIGLSLVAAAKGYKLCLAMSESVSEERKKILKAMGAELFFTESSLGTDGAIEKVYKLLLDHPDKYFGTDQFNNYDNVLAHYHGTAEEIWHQTDGTVTMVVSTLGTTGTAMGIAKKLKEYNQQIKIVGVEPYLQHKIQGLKNMKESYRPGIFDKTQLDEKVNIADEDAFEMARRLAREEGLLVGMSSGAAMHVAVQKAKEMEEGVIVVIFPDGGERYLSTDLFMDKEQFPIRIYNLLTKNKSFFKPINSQEVRMHTCGPTVHEVPHLGSYRRFVVSDMIRRYLEFRGYNVSHIMNIIDLDDRSIREAEKANLELGMHTKKCTSEFYKDIEKLNLKKDDHYPKASENVDAMLKLVEKLVQKGYAYEKLRSVYFDISKIDEYGCLSHIDPKKVKQGKTVDLDYYEKDSPVDFTLLKRSTLNELKKGIYFKTRWGNVRPSWHLECSAIALKYLADNFDIHASGADVVFPHCENVMAIGRAITGKRMANYWINTEIVMKDGKKMSRSLDNVYTIKDLEEMGFNGREIRLFLLNTHYRKPLKFSFCALEATKNTVRKLNRFIQRLIHLKAGSGYHETDQLVYELKQGFTTAMDDDFNISGGVASLFEFVNKIKGPLSLCLLEEKDRDKILDAMKKIDSVLGFMDFSEETLSDEVMKLLQERVALRKARNWQAADEIRLKLWNMGIEISDTPKGTTWRFH